MTEPLSFKESDETRILRRVVKAYASLNDFVTDASLNIDVLEAELILALDELRKFDAWLVTENERKRLEAERLQREAESYDKWRDSLVGRR